MGLFNWFTQEIAIDLGTANTLIIHNDEVVVNEPSIVALNRNNPKEVLAVGKKALMMHEKTHESIRTVRPLKDGVIADFNAAELMIRELIKLVYPKKPLFPPSWRMMICIPSSITEVEKRAVRDSAEQAGAKEVYLLHEPMAAALGIGIDVEEPVGNMIIDIGDHIAHRFFHINANTQGSGHGFVQKVYFLGAGLLGTVAHSSFFNFGNTRGNADHHTPAGWEQGLFG